MTAYQPAGRIEAPEDPFEFYEFAQRNGWTDGLPVLPPTPERVQAMVDASGRHREDAIADLPPRWCAASVERIAINAVMAGCLPEYMPVLIAAVRAIAQPSFNLHGIQCTTNPATPMLIVNGPIRRKLDIACGRGCLGPGFRANATIGRALRLILLNIGGGIPGVTDMAIHGMPGKFTMCFGELEEDSPWEPLHVERGLKPDESAVTVVGVQGTTNICPIFQKAETVLTYTADSLGIMGVNNVAIGMGNYVTVFPPGHAKLLANQGYDKVRVKQYLWENSKIPFQKYPREKKIGTSKIVRNGEYVYVTQKWEDLILVCAGGPEPYHIVSMPTFGDTWAVTERITDG